MIEERRLGAKGPESPRNPCKGTGEPGGGGKLGVILLTSCQVEP